MAELPPGTTWRLVKMQLQSVSAALAASLVLLVLATVLVPFWQPLLGCWIAAEAVFVYVFLKKYQRLNALPHPNQPADLNGHVPFHQWTLSDYITKTVHVDDYMSIWFPNIPAAELRRGNIAEMLAHGFWYRSRAEMEAEGKGHIIDQMLLKVEEVFGAQYPDGTNDNVTYYTHISEPLKAVYKPLAFYALSEVLAGFKHLMLLASGFKSYSYKGYNYYTYQLTTPEQADRGEGSSNSKEPLVFFHGVGAGLLPYVHIVQEMAALGHPVLAVEYKHLAMRWTSFIPDAKQVARDMGAILDLHGVDKIRVVAHSFGTFYASCLLKQTPDRVSGVCLIDPACCCMWSGHLIANFVYRPQYSTTGVITWFIARDIHTAASTARNFYWTEYNLWPRELPANSVIVLSGRDDLVPVAHVKAMVENETVGRCLLHPKLCHADFLFNLPWQREIMGAVTEMLAVPSSTSTPLSSTDMDVDSSILRRSSLQSTLSTSTLGSSSGWDYLNGSSSELEVEETSELLNPALIKQSAAAQLLQRTQPRQAGTVW